MNAEYTECERRGRHAQHEPRAGRSACGRYGQNEPREQRAQHEPRAGCVECEQHGQNEPREQHEQHEPCAEHAQYDLVVIGGGPAGMAAAVAAYDAGVKNVLIAERNSFLGGILPQCIHDGFGLQEFGDLMTGPEYASAWIKIVEDSGVDCLTDTTVVDIGRPGDRLRRSKAGVISDGQEPDGCRQEAISDEQEPDRCRPEAISDEQEPDGCRPEAAPDCGGPGGRRSGTEPTCDGFLIRISSPQRGVENIFCKSVILASGCRERSRGQLRIPGSRPAGIYTAGAVQYMMNVQNYRPGSSAVILGSGDIGLIMARRMKWEGINVKLLLGQQASGLLRNYIQCVKDWEIPIRFSYTVAKIHGRKRITGVTVAPVGPDGEPDMNAAEYIRCDLLVIAAGLIPETELWDKLRLSEDLAPGEIRTEDDITTEEPGFFICGNVAKQYDTVDEVSASGRRAGRSAAAYLLRAKTERQDATSFAQLPSEQESGNTGGNTADFDFDDRRGAAGLPAFGPQSGAGDADDSDDPFPAVRRHSDGSTFSGQPVIPGQHVGPGQHMISGQHAAPGQHVGPGQHVIPGQHVMTQRDLEYLSSGSDTDEEGRRIVYCICCPRGCRMTVGLAAAGRAKNAGEKERKPEEAFEKQPEERQAAAVFPEVRGFGCDAGRNYALQEITSPKRIVTTTVAVRGREDLLVPVRTSEAIDKSDVNKVLALCSRLSVRLPVTAGSIVREDVCGRGSGVDLVCCVDRTEPQTPAGSGEGEPEAEQRRLEGRRRS